MAESTVPAFAINSPRPEEAPAAIALFFVAPGDLACFDVQQSCAGMAFRAVSSDIACLLKMSV